MGKLVDVRSLKKTFLFSVLFLLFVFSINSNALAWTVSPVRFELKAARGKEYTLAFSVFNESQLHQKRFEIQTDDWTLDKQNNFLRKAYNKETVQNKYTATSWVKVTPQQFVLPPGETKKIRFTVAVPNDIQTDGEYTTGIFVGEKNIEKPLKGEKIVHIKQDTFIGVVVYVRIGKEESKVTLKDLKINLSPLDNKTARVTLLPLYENQGNVHGRAKLILMAVPENKDSFDKKLLSDLSDVNGGELVVLRESQLTFPVDVPYPIPINTEWKFAVSADFGGEQPVLVGTKKYKIEMTTSHPKIP